MQMPDMAEASFPQTGRKNRGVSPGSWHDIPRLNNQARAIPFFVRSLSANHKAVAN